MMCLFCKTWLVGCVLVCFCLGFEIRSSLPFFAFLFVI